MWFRVYFIIRFTRRLLSANISNVINNLLFVDGSCLSLISFHWNYFGNFMHRRWLSAALIGVVAKIEFIDISATCLVVLSTNFISKDEIFDLLLKQNVNVRDFYTRESNKITRVLWNNCQFALLWIFMKIHETWYTFLTAFTTKFKQNKNGKGKGKCTYIDKLENHSLHQEMNL